jgi:lipopolysaccharide transport system permease protein
LIRSIWQVRELLYTLVRRDLIVRYQSSVLGFLWSFANPLALVGIFYVAFSRIVPIGGDNMPDPRISFGLHLLVGILAWTYFSRCLSEGHWAVLSHANLIKKIKMPIEVFPAVTVTGNLINYLLGMLVVIPTILIWLPDDCVTLSHLPLQVALFLLTTLLLSTLLFALTLFVSAINVFYRDMAAITELGLQAWFYATPIIYPATLIEGKFPDWLERLYWCNPMAPIVVAYRRILLYSSPAEMEDAMLLKYLCVCVALTLALLIAAQAIFRNYARLFADEV